MPILPLCEILKFDNGENTADSFFVGPLHHQMQDFARLTCDLLLMTREVTANETPVLFADLPELVDQAAKRMSARLDEIRLEVWVVDTEIGLLWVPKSEQYSQARLPTPSEASDFEGESRILYDAASNLPVEQARRLFAAWGIYCCERAMRAMKGGGTVSSVAVLVASAGALLGHANWCEAYGTMKDKAQAERRRGGLARLAKDPIAAATQRAKLTAHHLWPEAKRKGWSAERMHLEIVRKGHEIKPSTVVKWMTKLRQTGTC